MIDTLPWLFPLAAAGTLAWRYRVQAPSRALTLFVAHAVACALLVALLVFITQSGIGRISQAMPAALQHDWIGTLACSVLVSAGYLLVVLNGRR